MHITEHEILHLLTTVLLPFFRIAALLMSMTVIGTRLLSARVRIMLALLTAFLIHGSIAVPTIEALSIEMMVLIAKQIITGVAIGFMMQLVFQAFIVGGQLIALQGGLGFASIVDPQNAMTVPSVSQFYLMLVTILFLVIDGHLLMIEMIVESFTTLPIDMTLFSLNSIWLLVQSGFWVFSGAAVIAMPAVIALLAVNIAFGIMTKASPQLNIFTVGFPITVTLALLLMFITLPLMAEQFEWLFNEAMQLMHHILASRA